MSGATLTAGGYIQIGKLVIINARFENYSTGNISFDVPSNNIISNGKNVVTLNVSNSQNSGSIINGRATITPQVGGGVYVVNATYICD